MIKLNKKGEMAWPIIFGAIIGMIIVLILMYISSDYIFGGAQDIAAFGSCEKGVVGESGICVPSFYTCKDLGGFENPGKLFGGCPSKKTKEIFLDNYKDYNQCCVLEKCSDVEEFEKSEYKTADDKAKCLGYAKDCTEKEQCCCVKKS